MPWAPLAWFTVLLALSYGPVLYRLAQDWENDEDMGHGFFVIPVALYIAWQSKDELLAAPKKTNWLGLALVLLAAVQLMLATLGSEFFLQRTAFIAALAGAILLLGGNRVFRTLWFPLVLLLFMVPIPAIIYNKITFPLQLFASQVAEWVLSILGYPVLREGNVLELASQRLNVVEACSGIRSLLSLSFLALVYGYFFDSRPWMKWLLFVLTVPIAIVANAARVTLTGILSEVNPEYAKGVIHTASGWVIFVVALVCLFLVHQLLAWLLARRGRVKAA